MSSYGKLCTEFYDLDKPSPPPEALAFYRAYAQRSGGRMLEPMCGSGRFLLSLLAEGHSIDGMDASPHMLAACRERGRRLGLAPTLYEQSLPHLRLAERYGLVMIPAGSFCLLTDAAEATAALECLHEHLTTEGTMVLEIERLVPFTSQPWEGRWVERPEDGARIVFSSLSRYAEQSRTVQSIHRYDLVRDGQHLETEWEELSVRLYEADEFTRLLETTGFSQIRCVERPYPGGTNDEGAFLFECRKG
jgi:hypothetical protein